MNQNRQAPTTALTRQIPHRYDALVLDGASRQSLAAVRSLGRSGLSVAVGECFVECQPELPVLSFRSRHVARATILPPYTGDGHVFAEAALEFVRRHHVRVVVPGSDGSVAALVPARAALAAAGAVLALPDDASLDLANDKVQTMELAAALGLPVPPTVVLTGMGEVDDALQDQQYPLVMKPSRSWVLGVTTRLRAVEVVDETEARRVASQFLDIGSRVLLQPWVGGRREGVTLLCSRGRILAAVQHLEHRTTPALGGASVVRESVMPSEDVLIPACQLVRAARLEGLAEVEFRRDESGTPLLMEINARLPGTTELAVRCGVDLPMMLWRWANGDDLDEAVGYRTGVRMRWLRGDMRWLRDNTVRVGRPDSVARARATWTFVSEFVRTPRLDCFDVADLGPAWVEMRTTVASVRDALRAPALSRG